MSDYRALTNAERAALQARTARSVRLLWAFKDMPVQVGNPCQACGCLFWFITGNQRIAPLGYCLNCHPEEIATRPKLLKLVRESMLDTPLEEEAYEGEEGAPDEDEPPDLAVQPTLF